MTFTRLMPAALLLAACATTDNTATTSAAGATEIQLVDGRNCWNNQCLRFSKVNRSVSVTGRHPVRVPRDIDVRDGTVSPSEFAAMFQRANMAYSNGVGRR